MTDKKLIDVAPELAQKILDDARTWTTRRESATDRTMLANGEIPAHLASPEKVDAEGFPITNRVELAYRMTGDLRRYADELHPGCEREVNLRVAADVIESLIEEYSEEMSNTPRTDELTRTIEGYAYVPSTFARELERELNAAKLDAARYRWLRVHSTGPAEPWSTHSAPESLDAAVDEAMTGNK